MSAPKSGRILAPRALFLGFSVAFLACCLAGYLFSKASLVRGFVRFHRNINPETSFYPTPDQVVNTVRKQTSPDKITVIVGGNSILFGTGQSEQGLWSSLLQELLGDEFRVINLGLPSAFPFEFAGTTAEILAKNHPRLIYVTYTSACSTTGQFDQTYRYFVWYARERGLLGRDPGRAVWMREVHQTHQKTDSWREFRRRTAVDRWCYCSDLWTTLSYHQFSTVWSYLLGTRFTAARKNFPDPDPGSSATQPSSAEQDQFEMNYLREVSQREDTEQSAANLVKFCPAVLKDRTVFLVVREHPALIRRLDDECRSKYEGYQGKMAAALHRLGFQAVNVTQNYPDHYFLDRCHLTEPGGHRLAEEAAPAIREHARRLGYLEEGE